MLWKNTISRLLGISTTTAILLFTYSTSFAEQIPSCADPATQEELTSGAFRSLALKRGVISYDALKKFLEGSTIEVNRKVGAAYEKFNRDNHSTLFSSKESEINTSIRTVKPDTLKSITFTFNYVRKSGVREESVAQCVFANSIIIDSKAVGQLIDLKYERQQIAAFLDYLSRSAAALDQPKCSSRVFPPGRASEFRKQAEKAIKELAFVPALVIVGFADTKIGIDVLKKANEQGIAVYRSIGCKIKGKDSVNIQVGKIALVNESVYQRKLPPGKKRWMPAQNNLFAISKIDTIYPAPEDSQPD